MKLLAVLALSAASFAQTIPPGTILPVELNSSLRSNKSHLGQAISARIMQDLPLAGGLKIRAGARVLGHVIAVTPATANAPASMSFTFDHVAYGKQSLPVVTNLRALAGMMEVEQAQVPQTGPDRGTSPDTWTTIQIGEEVAYHGAAVTQGVRDVGRSLVGGGVLAPISARPGSSCRGVIGESDQPQAFWVFSSDACGIYGYPNVALTHAGRTNPSGQITLQSLAGDLNIRSGSGLLLRVNAEATTQGN